MLLNKNKTLPEKINQTTNTQWYIIDAKNKNLGRLSSQIAYILRNKNNLKYMPYQISNTYIIIINSKHIKVTGNKAKQKTYKRHSGRPGGLKTETFENLQEKIPNRIIEHSIRGMLPKNSLGRKLFKRVKIYPNNQHPHSAQKPTNLNIK
uniref:Large ribosomal subunit protein uL13c n=1 Tax=Dasyclonium flaccidum TaxID=2007274 RepID=A0A1Z1MKS3_9FLOR|nr:ribosomal protein L13 [Dasyclonium flaccidum]ARW66687.1 ribosomal protein L13 [Dasyclonium flaccidum]